VPYQLCIKHRKSYDRIYS
jgi:hypothetical protein